MRHESLWQLALHYLRSFDAHHKPLITAVIIGIIAYCMAELLVAYMHTRNLLLVNILFAGFAIFALYLLALAEYPEWAICAWTGLGGMILGAAYRLWRDRAAEKRRLL